MCRVPGDDAWRWVVEHPSIFEDDGRLTFVRGADADAIFRAFDLDPAREPAVELVAALAMGSRELGFTLTAERCRGPLPTVYR
jgi:hypothetical protein